MFFSGNLTEEQLNARMQNVKRQKEQEGDIKTQIEAYFQNFRSSVLLLWVVSNVVLIQVVSSLYSSTYETYAIYLFVMVAFLMVIRVIGAILYLFNETYINSCFTVQIPRYPSAPRKHYPGDP